MSTTPYTNGYWTEGAIVNGPSGPTNVGGGHFVAGSAPAPTPTAPAVSTPSNPLVERYSSDRSTIQNNPALNVPQPNEGAVRDQYRSYAQGTVDAIRSQFDKYIQEDTTAKKALESKAYLSSLAAGMSGSPEGATSTYNAAEKGEVKVRQDKAKEEALIQQAYNGADLRASQEYQRQRTQYIASAKDKAAAESTLNSKVKTTAEGELKTFATTKSYDEWSKEAGPAKVQQYMKETGMDEMALKQYFINAKPVGDKVIDKQIGNNWVIGHRNPTTGEVKLDTIPLPDGSGNWKFQTIDGKGYFVDTNTQQIKPATGTNVPSGKQIKGAPTGFTDTDVAQGANFLKQSGQGGYASPNMYVALWKQFVETDGGDQATFLKVYPPDQYINPEDKDLLPTFLQPKVKAAASSSSSPAPTSTGRAF